MHFHLPTEGIDVLLAQVEKRRRVEAAVDATARTKWNMYV